MADLFTSSVCKNECDLKEEDTGRIISGHTMSHGVFNGESFVGCTFVGEILGASFYRCDFAGIKSGVFRECYFEQCMLPVNMLDLPDCTFVF